MESHRTRDRNEPFYISVDICKVLQAYQNFLYALKSAEVQRQYPKLLRIVFEGMGILKEGQSMDESSEVFLEMVKEDPQTVQTKIMQFVIFQKERVKRKEIASGTLKNYLKILKGFCDMNHILNINWKLIYKGLPPVSQVSNTDRIPTIEEIQALIYHKDIRIKVIVLVMASSGIRLGAWDFLRWGDITPIEQSGQIVAAKIMVYSGEPEQYYSFITREAYDVLKSWMEYRQRWGEKITANSWVMRDKWEKTNKRYGHNIGSYDNPEKLDSNGIRTMLKRAWRDIGVTGKGKGKGQAQAQNEKTPKSTHSFRKWFKVQCERSDMKSINIEILMGHNIGISGSYYMPTENQVLDEYLKAADDSLTIDEAQKLRRQVREYKIRADKIDGILLQIEELKKKMGLD